MTISRGDGIFEVLVRCFLQVMTPGNKFRNLEYSLTKSLLSNTRKLRKPILMFQRLILKVTKFF